MDNHTDSEQKDRFGNKMTAELVAEPPRRKGRVDKIAIAFQPDNVEVELRKLPVSARVAFYTILLLIISAVIWAAWAKVDKSIISRGKLVSQSRTVIQQPIKASVIRSLDAKSGDFVESGQLIATLDPTLSKADKGQIQAKITILNAELSRINAELERADMLVGNLNGATSLQIELFQQRKQEYKTTLSGFDARTQTLLARGEISKTQEEQIKIMLALAIRKQELTQQLADQGNTARLKLDEIKAEALRLISARAEKVADQERLKREIDSVEVEQEQFVVSVKRQLVERKIKIVNEIQQLDFALQKARKVGEFDEFFAPSNGIILDTTKKSVGSIVDAGEMLFTLVPIDKGLEIRIELSPRDIGWVHIGQAVRVKLDPFPFQRHGTLEGKLVSISPDSFQRSVSGQTQIYYKGKISIEENLLHNLPEGFQLLPGITVTAEIKIGKRTVLSYITDPFHKALDESLKEPN